MPTNPALGQWIRQRRASLGLTQAGLADQLGCSLSLLRKIERGERSLAPDLISRLAAMLAPTDDQRAALHALAGILAPGLAAAPPRRAGAIPAPPGPLLGRGADLAAVQRMLMRDGARLVTLSGPPGIGKTRLAQQVARDLRPLFADGVAYVALAALSGPEQVLPALARALDLRERPGAPLLDQIADHLHARQALLALDNVEHLLDSAPDLAAILAACPQAQIIATSRVPLRIRPEQVYPLAPLGLPESSDVERIARAPAVQLFVDRARALQPDFILDVGRAAAVAAIVARLDGLPLAIELAAARSDQLSPADLLAMLDSRLALLADGPRDLPARQRTLRDAIAWSYELLDPAAQAVFARLGVFVGGWEPADALALCADMGVAAEEILALLADHSLAQRQGERFMMLETLREFARDRLAATGALATAQARHAAHFARLVERAEPELRGPDATAWLERLDAQVENLRAARRWSLDHDGGIIAAQIISAGAIFWRTRGYFDAGRPIEALLLRDESTIPAPLRARALYIASFLASQQDDARCVPLLEAAVALYRRLDDPIGTARCLNLQGLLARVPGGYGRSAELHRAALGLVRELDAPDLIGSLLNHLGMALAYQGAYGEAIGHYSEALRLARGQGDRVRLVERLPNLGEALLLRGDHEDAAACYREALDLARVMGHRDVIAECQEGMGRLALLRGDLASAAACLDESLQIYREVGIAMAISRLLRSQGYLALRSGSPADAAMHFSASLALCSLPGYADTMAHTLAGMARAAELLGDSGRAATLAGGAESLRLRYGLRAEPEDVALRAALAPLAAAEPARWAAGLAAEPGQIIAAASG